MASATKTVEDDIQALRQDVAALAQSVGDIVASTAAAAEKGVNKGMNGAARAGHEFMSDAAKLKSHSANAAGEMAGEATSFIAGEIKRNPFMAVAAALAIGFVAGIARPR
jgi:ElaB/YqjD/DUF883 family membrane-anchored ribosome-binding protein